MDAPPAVDVRGAAKSFGRFTVLRGLDLTVPAGTVVSIFGPNGAGKTTLLRIIAMLARADAGTVLVNGVDTAKQGEIARGTLGAVMHSPMLYGDLTARENLLFYCKLFRLQDPGREIARVAELMNVSHRLDDRVRNLSHGLQKRVALARALLHRPRLLLLDEPESGLDRRALRQFERLLAGYREAGGAVLMTTHALERGAAISDRVAILAAGRIVFYEDASELDGPGMDDLYRRYSEQE